MNNTKNIIKRNVSNQQWDKVVNSFSLRLVYALAIRKMSQAELASACQIAPSHISQYINKDFTPRIDKIKKIAEKLNVSELWLIGNGSLADIDKRQDLDTLPPDERSLLKIYRGTDLEGKKFLLNMAKIYEKMRKDD